MLQSPAFGFQLDFRQSTQMPDGRNLVAVSTRYHWPEQGHPKIADHTEQTEGRNIEPKRICNGEGFLDEKEVKGRKREKSADQPMAPFPQMIGNEGYDRRKGENKQSVETDFTDIFGNSGERTAPKTVHFSIDNIVQAHRDHGDDTEPFVQDINPVKRTKYRFETWHPCCDELVDAHQDQR